MIEKFVDRPSDVTSRHEIEADLGVGDRRLYVLSGIVLLGWKIDSDRKHTETLVVHLRRYVRDFEQGSAFVALAVIAADETGFTFATDQAEVKPDPATGELLLTVELALQGEWAALVRVSYQVVVTAVQTRSMIKGRILWNRSLWDVPKQDVTMANRALSIMANQYETNAGDSVWAPSEKLTPVKGGQVESLTVEGDDFVASYRIPDPPLGMELQVIVKTLSDFGTAGTRADQIAGPLRFTLTAVHPEEIVDFRIVSTAIK